MSAGKFLYILCEGELDELFYERLCERITGQSYEQPQEFRVRRGSNFKTAIAAARVLLSRFRHWTQPQDVAVIIAVDNDRAPSHPGSSPAPRPLPPLDLKKAPRYSALVALVNEMLGADPSTRSVDAALAVPVEMIESWLLLLLDPAREELPLFSDVSPISRHYYGGKNPPPQLKNLRDEAAATRGLSLDDLFYEAADQGDLDRLAARSPSFALFRDDLKQWRNSSAPDA